MPNSSDFLFMGDENIVSISATAANDGVAANDNETSIRKKCNMKQYVW